MIIMINGAFGVGKTTTAQALNEELANSMIYDPELVGGMLRHILPNDIKRAEATTGDFQDFVLWKELTVEMARRLVQHYQLHLIVPMTIRKPEYFDYIYNGFKSIDEQTYHFCLTASKETIHKRLKERGEQEGNWCFYQTDKCLDAYEKYNFGREIATENVNVETIIKFILNEIQQLKTL